ncbi:hypothetical protein [Pseudomonas sp. A014]|uniref:hypothetical protein n=1 Tax=Pseudomonas sp. A014 TaxID=3458058 RepID=UPI004035F4D7
MHNTAGRNAAAVEQMATLSMDNGVDLRTVELDVQSQESVDAAVASPPIDPCSQMEEFMSLASCPSQIT